MTSTTPSRRHDGTYVYVDADACPVKDEVYRVTARHGVPVKIVSGTWMNVPQSDRIELQVAGAGFDAADDLIVEQATASDVVITSDIPLAHRCVALGAAVLSPTGQVFDEENISERLATRDLLAELRGAGEQVGGPPPFEKKHRSLFLQRLEEILRRVTRSG